MTEVAQIQSVCGAWGESLVGVCEVFTHSLLLVSGQMWLRGPGRLGLCEPATHVWVAIA